MNTQANSRGTVAAVGTFDGFHPGHQAIVKRVVDEAEREGLRPVVLTFDRHPLSVIAAHRAPGWAYPRSESNRLMREAGVVSVIPLPFTEELRRLTAQEFIHKIKSDYGVGMLVMGYDNTFGSDRLQHKSDYEAAGSAEGVRVVWVEAVETAEGERPSSSKLRKALSWGDIALYAKVSGHLPMLIGEVVHGRKNGRKIGFPTMNVATENATLPAAGVYAARYIPKAGVTMPAVLNVGTNPTVGSGNPVTVEVHVPGADLGDMYGQGVKVELVGRLRDERKFESLEALREAIAQDARRAVSMQQG